MKTGGKSSYQAAQPGQPYRVNGIRGIEFGSTDNAPTEGSRPLLTVSYDADGNAEFRQIKWRESRELSDSIYGFNRAILEHTYDSGQLSRVTLIKSFPLTEQGMRQATEFYAAMSGEASTDLGFEVIDVDRTGNAKSPRICEFTNRDGDTSISGGMSVWSEKSVSVTLSVSDKAYTQMLSQQSKEAYNRGDESFDNARVEVWGQDYTASKSKANALLGK